MKLNGCKDMKACIEQEINAFLWLFLTTIFSLHKLVNIFFLWAKARPIPGPTSPSFFGHCSLISASSLSDLLSVSHKEYGPVVKLWLSPSQLLVSIMDPQLIEEMLSKAADKLPLTGRALRLALGRSRLFVSSYSKVENQRISLQKALSGELNEKANVKQLMHSVIQSKIRSENGYLDSEEFSQHLAFMIQGATIFGDLFLTWPKVAIYEELLVKIAKDSCSWASYSVPPLWKPSFRNYQVSCSTLKSLTEELVQKSMEKYKQDRLKGQISNTNLIQHLFSLENNHCGINDEAFGDLISILFHGSLTTAGLISSMLARLVSHPELQDEIYSEITTAENISRSDEDQLDTRQLPLLLATIYETARLLPAGTFLQRRSLEQDLNLSDGTIVPAGAILIVPVQLVQIDSSAWGNDASLFNPYRFLLRTNTGSNIQSPSSAGHGSYVLRDPNTNASFLPFGSGARACVGQRLAISTISNLFASLLKQYEVRLQPSFERHVMQKMHNNSLNLLPNSKIIFIQRGS